MAIYGYARVSTKEQAIEFNALDQQISRLKSAGVTDDFILIDIESGRKDTRKNYKKLVALIEQGKVTEIVCTRIDRLGRSSITLGLFFALCEKNKIKVRGLDTPIDFNSPFGWHSAHQMFGLAEFESRLLSQRIQYGMDYFINQRKIWKTVFGYRKNSDGKLEPNTELCETAGISYWELARVLIDKMIDGESSRSITKYLYSLGINMTDNGILKWANNPILLGHTAYFRNVYYANKKSKEKLLINDTHQALITQQELDIIAKQRLKNRTNFNCKKTMEPYPLRGKFICGICGHSMYRVLATDKNRTTRVKCSQRNKGVHLCSNVKTLKYPYVVREVIEEITKIADKLVVEIQQQNNQPIKENEQLKSLRKNLSLLEAMDNNPAIATAINDIKIQIKNLEFHENKNTVSVHDTEETKMLLSAFPKFAFWESLPEDELTIVFDKLVEKVIITNGSVSVSLNL